MALIAGLYVSQAVPLGFFIVALPAILRRQGLGLEQTGMLSALAFPWLIKFLWAPLVDRFGSERLGHYRAWILPLQTFLVLVVIGLSQIDISRGLLWLIVGGTIFMLTSATQDIATDGLAVRIVDPPRRGPANGIQVGGYYLGQIFGGGVVLVLYDRVGWTAALLAMAGLLTLPLLQVLRFHEPPFRPRTQQAPVSFGALKRFFQRPGAAAWIPILLIYRAGETTATTMFNPMLVDAGLSLGEIGLMLGLAASVASLAGALTGGALIPRVGRKPSLVLFGSLQAVALCAYLVPAAGMVRPAAIYGVAMAVAFAGGMATAALYTNMMDRSDPRTGATDFTLQQSLCAFGPVLGASLSGLSAARLGYTMHFVLCASVSLVGVLIVARWLSSDPARSELEAEPVAEAG